MIKECAHEDMEYLSDKRGVIDFRCKICGEVIEQYQDCPGGR